MFIRQNDMGMTSADIEFVYLAFGLLLMAVPLFYLWRLRTGLLAATVIATLRMCVQLLLTGIYLRYLFLWDCPWVNLLWVVMMVGVASHTAVSRTRLRPGVLLLPVFVGFFVTAMLVGLYFLGLVLQLDNIFGAQYFIPVMGILLGNMLSVNVVALEMYYSDVQREQQMYYYLLGNGATRFEATAPFLRRAVIKAFSPCIANMAVLGVVSLPGTMIGQILGGSQPGIAVKYQMMITVITVAASMLSLMITVALSAYRSFDAFGRLLPVFRREKHK